MNSPAPNIPGAASAMSPFTKYMNELELEATSKDFIRAGDTTPTLSLHVMRMPRFTPTYKYLSVPESEFSHRYSTVERKQSLIGIRATNDEAESVLGDATANIQQYGRISLSGAGAVGDMKRNARGSTGQVPASFFRNRKNKWAEVPRHSLL